MKKLRVLLALLFFWSILPALPGWAAAPVVGDLVVKESPWVDVRAYGAVCDNVINDSPAFALATVAALVTGKELRIPAGWCYLPSQWVLSSDNTAHMKPLKIVGAGADSIGSGLIYAPSGGTVLRMTYGSGPKVSTKSVGLVEITGVNFYNDNTDTQPFVYTEQTTIHAHNNAFWGGSNKNDGFHFGGDNVATAFQGYGTVIRDNYFQKIGRAAYLRKYANAVVFSHNNIWNGSGGTTAIEIDGKTPDAVTGTVFEGNLIEMVNYSYGFKLTNAHNNYFAGNSFFDGNSSTWPYYLDSTSTFNTFIEGYVSSGTTNLVYEPTPGKNTILRNAQNQASSLGETYLNVYNGLGVRFFKGYGPGIYLGDNTSTWRKTEQIYNSGSVRLMKYSFYSDNGAVQYSPFIINTYPDANWVNTTTDLYSDYTFRLRAAAKLELWGNELDFKDSSGAAFGYWNSDGLTLQQGTLNTLTGGSTTISTGVGSVKMSTVNAATNTVWIPMRYNGTTYYVPGWTTNAP